MNINIIIKNQNSKVIDSVDINSIKTITGEFTRETIEAELGNLLYSKAVIDITAIKNFFDIKEVLRFLSFFGPNKTVLLLNNSELVNSSSYLTLLVQNGYYNFTRNAAGINYLLTHPNTLNDVTKYINSLSQTQNQSIELNRMGPNTFGNQTFQSNPYTSNSYINDNYNPGYVRAEESIRTRARIIGIQNVTEHAGATTLMYMILKQLRINYKVKAFEMFKQDSIYLKDSDISFCTSVEDLKYKINTLKDTEIILIDLNGLSERNLCQDILYLVNPGIISLNKALKKDINIREKIADGKIILNQSAIKDEELSNFEYETKFKVYYNMPVINDRAERLLVVDKLLLKLGFGKQGSTSFFGLFK